jgi:outer membrane protein OmpA-like peptidoglycan-associated protein
MKMRYLPVALILAACAEYEPVPPIPHPPHCADRLVFFGSGDSTLSDHSRQSLVSAFTAEVCGYGRIDARSPVCFQVVGHTDQTGPEEENRRLSKARADAVAEYIIELGVAREHIVVLARGSLQPLVQQPGPGGREPQNRRVEVSLALRKDGSTSCR